MYISAIFTVYIPAVPGSSTIYSAVWCHSAFTMALNPHGYRIPGYGGEIPAALAPYRVLLHPHCCSIEDVFPKPKGDYPV